MTKIFKPRIYKDRVHYGWILMRHLQAYRFSTFKEALDTARQLGIL